MSKELLAAFLDFQQHGHRRENYLLRFACALADADKRLAETEIVNISSLNDLVKCKRNNLIPCMRLKKGDGYICYKIK